LVDLTGYLNNLKLKLKFEIAGK